MIRPNPVRLVYSTGVGRVCATCGWPANECKCSSKLEEKIPSRVVVKLRAETRGRNGKAVTILDGLPRNTEFLEKLAKDLKKALGTGGTAGDGFVELQGDCREPLRRLLSERGFAMKG